MNRSNIFCIIALPVIAAAIVTQTTFHLGGEIAITPREYQSVSQISSVNSTYPSIAQAQEKAKVSFVYDGDTIVLSDNRKVRYIGIDTPEIGRDKIPDECFAKEAVNMNIQLVNRREIEMEKDISETDKYGRLLRYVWVDNVFINEFLVRQGYARLETIPPDTRYYQLLKSAEIEARESGRGLWGKCKWFDY